MAILNTEPNSIEAVVRTGINAALLDLRTIHPCKVKVVRDDSTVDVELMIHTVFIDGTSLALPVITRLPVLIQGNSQFTISFPVSEGDEGLALFAERDISRYLEQGEEGPPNALRRHSLSDGLFMPTPISQPKKLEVKPGVLLMSNNATEIEIGDGVIRMKGDIEIDGGIQSTGAVASDGEVTALASGTAVNLSTHVHTNGNNGANTGGPVG